jgi:hypothetical protein
MKTSPLALAVFLGATVSVDAAVLSAAGAGDRSAPSPSLFTKSKALLSKLNPRVIYPTAIGRDVAATHSGTTGGSLHGIVGQVERDLASRRLLINQDEAAKRVRDAVTAAKQAVDNGETSGVALPLDYVQLFNLTQQVTVRLRLPGVDRDLNTMIDTGSSALAFCDKSLIDEAKNISKTNYAQCVTYSSPVSCPDKPNSTGFQVAYAGQVFQGDVGAYNDQGEKVTSMDNVSFGIMAVAQDYTCFGPLDGKIGVAYKGNSNAFKLPSPDFNVSSLWKELCTNPDQDNFSAGFEKIGKCDTDNMTDVSLKPPLEQTLVENYNSGQITADAFGVYLDYAATIGSKVDTLVPSLGIFFGGDLAYDNPFYNNGKVQVAKTVSPNNGDPGLLYWYMLNFTSIRVPDFNVTQSTVDLCAQPGQCITDTGNSYIELPLPEDVCNRLKSTGADELKEKGSLLIDITAADGKDDITLSFPLLWLREQLALGHVVCQGTTGNFALGLPTTQYYYTVYDMGKDTVSFVELNLSNETQAFIDGPELGGSPTPQPTSKGCFRHTVGLSLLAWIVFVPSAAVLIASL